MATKFKRKCRILSDLWLNFRNEEEFTDFITYNDLGLPLAYAINTGLVGLTDEAEKFINETFDLLLAGLGIEEDTGFRNLDQILDIEQEGGSDGN